MKRIYELSGINAKAAALRESNDYHHLYMHLRKIAGDDYEKRKILERIYTARWAAANTLDSTEAVKRHRLETLLIESP